MKGLFIILQTSDLSFNVFECALSVAQGLVDGTLLTAKFGLPSYLAIDGAGNLYVSDRLSNNYDSIRRLSVAYGNVTTMAGKTCEFLLYLFYLYIVLSILMYFIKN